MELICTEREFCTVNESETKRRDTHYTELRFVRECGGRERMSTPLIEVSTRSGVGHDGSARYAIVRSFVARSCTSSRVSGGCGPMSGSIGGGGGGTAVGSGADGGSGGETGGGGGGGCVGGASAMVPNQVDLVGSVAPFVVASRGVRRTSRV